MARQRSSHQRLERIMDGALFAVAFGIAYSIRVWFPWLNLPHLEPFREHIPMFPFVALLGPTVLASQHFYDPSHQTRRGRTAAAIRSALLAVMASIVFIYIAGQHYARSVILMTGFLGSGFAWLRSEWFPAFAVSRAGVRTGRDRVLWVGKKILNDTFRANLSREEKANLHFAGYYDPTTEAPEALTARLHQRSVNVVVLNLLELSGAQIQHVLDACELEGISVVLRTGFLTGSNYGLELDLFAGETVVHYRSHASPPAHLLIKTAIDKLGAAIGLLLLSPVLVATMLAIRLTSPGPVFFKQLRSGINGRPFRMWKFRTMREGAHLLQASLAAQNEMQGPVFKIANDPRLTPIGAFLRRHSIDELPQLWNVLVGDMSLVGPRPLPIREVKRIRDVFQRRRLSMRPGLTCLWQISGRNDITSFDDWVRLDLAYIDRWSLILDFRIMVATLPVVFFGRGAR